MDTKIYSVKTCKFTGSEDLDGVRRLSVVGYTDRYCALDSECSMAIDIFTNEKFRMLYKTEDNKVASFEKINLGQEYASYVQSLDLNELTKKELLRLKYAYLKFMLLNKFTKKEVSKQNVIKR